MTSEETTPIDPNSTRVLPETYAENDSPSHPAPKPKRPFGLALLWVLLLISLALNGLALFWINALQQGLMGAQVQLREMVSGARTDLQAFGAQPLKFQVAVDQQIPISETVAISDTFVIPINTVFPFSTRVNTTINIPLFGPQEVSIPVSASVPVNTTFEVPIRADFPISMTFHFTMDLPVEITLPPELLEPIDQMLQQAEDGLR